MKFNTIPKILLLITLIVQTVMAQGQMLKINYQDQGNNDPLTLPLAIGGKMIIDPIDGHITVSTSFNASEIGLGGISEVPTVGLSITNSSSTSARINWVLGNDPVYCEKSGLWSGFLYGGGVVPNSSEVVNEGGFYFLKCHNSVGVSQTAAIQVTGIVGVPTLNLSIDDSVVNSGGSTTIRWTIGNSPNQCVKTGDWPTNGNMSASDIENGPHELVISNITSSKSFSLECTNSLSETSGVKSVSVGVAGGASWPSCSGQAAAILNGNEDRSILAQAFGEPTNYNGLYEDIYNNSGTGSAQPWPGTLGANLSLNLEKNHYIAAKFTTSSASIDAKFLSQVPSNLEGVPAQGFTVSISECPGDFNVHLNQAACKFNFESFKWSTTPNPPGPDGFFCELEKNKTYYLNIVHSDNNQNNNYATSDCVSQGNSCGHLSSQSLIIIGREPEDD